MAKQGDMPTEGHIEEKESMGGKKAGLVKAGSYGWGQSAKSRGLSWSFLRRPNLV